MVWRSCRLVNTGRNFMEITSLAGCIYDMLQPQGSRLTPHIWSLYLLWSHQLIFRNFALLQMKPHHFFTNLWSICNILFLCLFLSARIISLVFSWLWKPPLPNSTFMVITVALCLHLMGTQSHPGGEKLGARQLPTRNSQASGFFIHPRDPRVLKPLYSMKFLETSGPNLRSQNFPIKQGPNGTCQAKILLRAQSLHLKQSCEPSMLHHNGCKML